MPYIIRAYNIMGHEVWKLLVTNPGIVGSEVQQLINKIEHYGFETLRTIKIEVTPEE